MTQTKITHAITLTNGTTETRKSAHAYTHAVIVTVTEAGRAHVERLAAEGGPGCWSAVRLDRWYQVGNSWVGGWSKSAVNAAKMADKLRRDCPGCAVEIRTDITTR